jgi:hypothetical protein
MERKDFLSVVEALNKVAGKLQAIERVADELSNVNRTLEDIETNTYKTSRFFRALEESLEDMK